MVLGYWLTIWLDNIERRLINYIAGITKEALLHKKNGENNQAARLCTPMNIVSISKFTVYSPNIAVLLNGRFD